MHREMDKKIIKGLIDEKLEVIQEQFSIIKTYEGRIPVIELDLVMAGIRDLYELFLTLQMENMGGVIVPKPEPAREEHPVPVPPSPEITEKPVESEAPVEEEEPPSRVAPAILSFEPVIEEKPEEPLPVEEEKIAVPTFDPAPVPEPVPEIPEPSPEPVRPADRPQRITLDLFSENSGATLADRLREGQDKRLADKLQENKIVDLRNTIGINDKFLFINELFEGNMRIYDDAIQNLNASMTSAQADLLMLDLKIAFNWDSESPTVKKFVELVRRKF